MLDDSMIREFGDENLDSSEDDLRSYNGSENETDSQRFSVFNHLEQYDPTFKLGMMFSTKKELRVAIHSQAIKEKRNINIMKNDKTRVHAKCADKECGWKLHALKIQGECTFQIKKYVPTHTCGLSFYVKSLKSSWLAHKYANKFNSDPKRNIMGFRVDAMEDLRCHVSYNQAYIAKRKAIDLVQGPFDEQYSLVWDFADEVKRANPGSTIVVGTDDSTGQNRFDRLYLCLNALREGFLAGCRPFIGIDGCHLRGPTVGVLLTAVGVDPNNNIFPISYAVVMKETGETWCWFLSLLKLELKIERDYEWTFMSDKQKGLIQAMQEVFPNAQHRFCVRHMHANFRNAGFRGQAFKHAIWECARATTVNEFDRKIKELRKIDENAYQWFNDKKPNQWSRSHFQEFSKCDMLLNNGCESFNSVILEAREKPLISMLEWIMEYLMQRMQTNRDRAEEKWKGILCPKIEKIIEKTSKKVGDCLPIKADAFHYQISCFDAPGTRYSVNLKMHKCGCRKWDLSGIPCNHALCAIYTQGLDYHDFTHTYYSVETYKKVYAPVIIPINGRNEWQDSAYISPLPPIFEKSIGRPKKARRRESDEQTQKRRKRTRSKPQLIVNANKMKRQQHTLKCSQCGAEGHNKRTCPPMSAVENPTYGETRIDEDEQIQSQLTQEIPSTVPKKLQVRRKVSFYKDVVVGQPSNSFDMSNVKKNVSTIQPTLASGQRSNSINDVYAQFQQYQNSVNNMNIRVPAHFIGGPMSRYNIQSFKSSDIIVAEGGKEVLPLSYLRSSQLGNKNASGL